MTLRAYMTWVGRMRRLSVKVHLTEGECYSVNSHSENQLRLTVYIEGKRKTLVDLTLISTSRHLRRQVKEIRTSHWTTTKVSNCPQWTYNLTQNPCLKTIWILVVVLMMTTMPAVDSDWNSIHHIRLHRKAPVLQVEDCATKTISCQVRNRSSTHDMVSRFQRCHREW